MPIYLCSTSHHRQRHEPSIHILSDYRLNSNSSCSSFINETASTSVQKSSTISPAAAGVSISSSSTTRTMMKRVPTSTSDMLDDEAESLSTLTTSLDDRETSSISGCGVGADGAHAEAQPNNNNEHDDDFRNLPRFKYNLGQMFQRQNSFSSSTLLRFFSNLLGYFCCTFNLKQRSR